jgi:uncharacterized protein (TIGR03067 family)
MFHRGAGILSVWLLSCACAHADDAASREVKELEGEWQAVEIERGGKKSNAEEVMNIRMIFKGNEITLKSVEHPDRVRKKTFRLDPGKSPKEIDITSPDMFPKEIQTVAGIYTLVKGRSGSRLWPCTPDDTKKVPGRRPKEFKTRAGDGVMVMVLERVNPK